MPQFSLTVSVPVAASVPDQAFLALVVEAVKACLEVEKDPGPTSSNVSSDACGNSACAVLPLTSGGVPA